MHAYICYAHTHTTHTYIEISTCTCYKSMQSMCMYMCTQVAKFIFNASCSVSHLAKALPVPPPPPPPTSPRSQKVYPSIAQRVSRIVLHAIHGIHREDERRPNPVFLSVAYLVYVRFDQIVTSYTLLPYVVATRSSDFLSK